MALIGISGKIGSGKDTVGAIIQQLHFGIAIDEIANNIEEGYIISGNSEYQIKKFADKLKEIVCLLIGCTREQLEDRDFKEQELSQEWWCHKVGFLSADGSKIIEVLKSYNEEINNAHQSSLLKLTPRSMLQLLGTEAGRRVIHPNIWVNSLFSTYTSESNWIITDVRFPNEADIIKEKGGKIIRLVRNSELLIEEQSANINHVSETSLDDYQRFDNVVENDGSILDLVEKISTLGYE